MNVERSSGSTVHNGIVHFQLSLDSRITLRLPLRISEGASGRAKQCNLRCFASATNAMATILLSFNQTNCWPCVTVIRIYLVVAYAIRIELKLLVDAEDLCHSRLPTSSTSNADGLDLLLSLSLARSHSSTIFHLS